MSNTSSSSINRQQRDNPNADSAPPAYDPIVVEESSITQSDLRKLLQSSKRTGDFVCLVAEKKKIIGDLVVHHTAISEALANVDTQNIREQRDSSFKSCFESYTANYNTQLKINRASSSTLSDQMIDLFSIFKEVIENPKFRSTTRHVRGLTSKMDEAVAFLVAEKADGKETSALLRGEKRTNQQLERRHLEGGGTLPRDECLFKCAYCKHPSVDEPPENKNVQSVNEDRLAQHADVVLRWNKFKDGKGPCPKTATNKVYTRCPPPPKTESLLLQCHCHQMTCSRKGSDIGSTCIIGCCKTDGEPYEWSEGCCTCPICCCPCKKSYAISNIAKIGIDLTRSKATGDGRAFTNERREAVEQANAKNFLGDCMKHGAMVAQAALDTLGEMNKKGM